MPLKMCFKMNETIKKKNCEIFFTLKMFLENNQKSMFDRFCTKSFVFLFFKICWHHIIARFPFTFSLRLMVIPSWQTILVKQYRQRIKGYYPQSKTITRCAMRSHRDALKLRNVCVFCRRNKILKADRVESNILTHNAA